MTHYHAITHIHLFGIVLSQLWQFPVGMKLKAPIISTSAHYVCGSSCHYDHCSFTVGPVPEECPGET